MTSSNTTQPTERVSLRTRLTAVRSRHVLHTIAVAGAITALTLSLSSAPKAQPAAEVTPRAEAIPFADYVSGAALVESSGRDALVASPVSGIISAVHVTVGQSVKAGDPLFTIDQRTARADVAARRAAVAVARAEQLELEEAVEKATLDLQRLSAIDDARAVSEEERASRQSTARGAVARLVTAQTTVRARLADLAAAQVSLDERVVRAPMAGDVLGITARVGEATGSGSSAPVRLGQVNRLQVRVDIDENDAWRVRPGSRARLIMRGNGALTADLRYEYIERYVRPKTSLTGASTERVDTRVLQLVYSLGANALPLYVGQQVDVLVEVPSAERGKP